MCTETTNWQLLNDADGAGSSIFQIGDNPYQLPRMTVALGSEDFKELSKRGFTHVRIPIDPWAIGMLESPGFGLPPTYQVSDAGKQVLAALVNDIEAAWDNGVWTIVDFHPVVNARGHWNLFYNQTIGPPLLNATSVAPIDYPGVYKWHFFKKGTATTPSPLTQAWTSIMQSFTTLQHPVVFEILNEPLDSEWDRSTNPVLWGLDGAGSIGGLPFNPAQPTTWMEEARANWKDITLETVRAIEGENRYIVVSPPTETALEYAYVLTPLFDAYTLDDCVHPENLIYTCHFYVPGDFTQHLKDYLLHKYQKPRDFFGQGLQVYQDTPMNAKFSYVQQWYAQNSATLEGIQIPLHLMFTEFGAVRDNRTRPGAPGSPPMSGGRGFPTGDGPGGGSPGPGYPVSLDMDSAKWIYDARKGIEATPQFGWTYFNVLGGFGAYDGSLNNNGWGQHGNWMDLNEQVRDALFAP